MNTDVVTINKLFFDGDCLIEVIQKEIGKYPFSLQSEMKNRFNSLKNEWLAFKKTAEKFSNNIDIFEGHSESQNKEEILAKSIQALERTSQSLNRSERVAKETEDMGTNILDELERQRESLLRTRNHLDDNSATLRGSRRIIRTLNFQFITNKLILIIIIILQIFILVGILIFRLAFPLKNIKQLI